MKRLRLLFVAVLFFSLPFLLGVGPFVRTGGEPQVQGPMKIYDELNVTGVCTLDDDLIVDGGEIGVTGDLDLLQLSNGDLDVNGTSEFVGSMTVTNAGSDSNSYKILYQAHMTAGDETQTSSMYTAWGADPYLVIATPNATGVETSTLHIRHDLFAFATDNQTDIGAVADNRPKDYYGSGNMTVAGNVVGNRAAYAFIPIEYCHDGAAAPAPAGEVDSGNGTVMAREFGGAAGADVHDIVCPWEVPTDIVAASGIKFRVSAVVTNAAGPTNQGLSFKLSGYSIGDNDPIGAAFGSEIEVTKTALTAAQFDRLQTAYSGVVTVTNLAAGELAMLHFERDTADASDDYLKPIGVTGIPIKYEGLTAGF